MAHATCNNKNIMGHRGRLSIIVFVCIGLYLHITYILYSKRVRCVILFSFLEGVRGERVEFSQSRLF